MSLLSERSTAMSPGAELRPLHPHALRAMLGDRRELALIDLREELISRFRIYRRGFRRRAPRRNGVLPT